jgi:hypothetical protein
VAFRNQAGNPDFYRVLSLLRELQESSSFGVRSAPSTVVFLRSKPATKAEAETAKRIRELLHLNPDSDEFKVVFGATQQDDKEVAIVTRSMLDILAETSAGVEIPASDIEQGRVNKMDSTELGPQSLVHVHSSTSKPEPTETFSAVRYRNRWFWVGDRDARSKSGLGFLMVLLSLAESVPPVQPPILTISKP